MWMFWTMHPLFISAEISSYFSTRMLTITIFRWRKSELRSQNPFLFFFNLLGIAPCKKEKGPLWRLLFVYCISKSALVDYGISETYSWKPRLNGRKIISRFNLEITYSMNWEPGRLFTSCLKLYILKDFLRKTKKNYIFNFRQSLSTEKQTIVTPFWFASLSSSGRSPKMN